LEAEIVSQPDSLARRPIDPAMGNSFGSYSEPGTRNYYQAETSPMVRDDDVATPELRRRRGEGVGSHNNNNNNNNNRLSFTVQRFNAVILHDSFPPSSDLWPPIE